MYIDVIDDLAPEDVAMLQSLYSRSPESVKIHLNKVREAGSGKFMDKYYVGYGHKSIGDCGTTTIFIEGVSMLAAKAIQDWPLYSGQEASTRYLDFRKMGCFYLNETQKEIQDKWMALYEEALVELKTSFEEAYPIKEGQKPEVWRNAINAKAFDVARGLLPAGTKTLLSWHTNLRQAHDHLLGLEQHPLEEVRNIAADIRESLKQKYKNSFSHEVSDEVKEYYKKSIDAFTYQVSDVNLGEELEIGDVEVYTLPNNRIAGNLQSLLSERPRYTPLHRNFEDLGNFGFNFLLDFGSYRDLQRHRNCILSVPLLTPYKFHPWYFERYSENLKQKIVELWDELIEIYEDDDTNPYTMQYIIPMGFIVELFLTCGLTQSVYLAELRSGITVHSTLRPIAQAIGDIVSETFPGIKLYINHEESEFDIKRGQQTIVEKDAS